jgi:hypothetical protein
MATYIDQEDQKEENNKRESPPTPTFDSNESEHFFEARSQLLTPFLVNPEPLHQNQVLSLDLMIPALFDNAEQRKITQVERYRQLDSQGIILKKSELQEWARLEMSDCVKCYRKSGVILTGGTDISNEFAIYVAKENCRKGQEPTIALGFNVINKCEKDPRSWQKLTAWVIECYRQTNIAASVVKQQRSLEIDEVLAGI